MKRPPTATRGAKALALALALILLLAGCGAEEKGTPAACLAGPGPYLDALAAAPGEATLPGGEPISACLAPNQEGAALAGAGGAMIAAATRLNREAREERSREAALRLGYLVGAAERGAESTEGIHAELLRRLEAAATFAPAGEPLSDDLERAYRSGLAAGRERG